jgi:type IV secretory pathway ATPase VirB11/archaellum biosynthesis ATPase
MSTDIAGVLRATARERKSFIVMAVPRLAGKTTVLQAILAERPKAAPLRTVAEDGEDIPALLAASKGGYLLIPEITQSAAMPGYIWGAPVRRIFTAIGDGVTLAATLHAESPEDAFAQICRGCGVPDSDAQKIAVAVCLRSIGRWEEPSRRVVDSVHEVTRVNKGRPETRVLYHWDEKADRFV